MPITLTANYKETLSAVTVEKIEEFLEDDYDLPAILEFIDENSEEDLVNYYEEYVRCGEQIGYEAVDALIEESGIDAINECDERYQGHYQSTADFAEEFFTEMGYSIPDGIVVDWEATWDRNLYYDFTACNDGQVYCPIHIFRDH